SGYPLGLKGDDIPISGRVVAITDVFDALTSARVYKAAWSVEKALNYIKEQREKQFDPDIVDAFFVVAEKIMQIKQFKTDEHIAKPIIQQVLDGDISVGEAVERWR
ncbi:MAG TPA: hypothetical protein DHW81_05385, partial [Nitrospiraceae bacterium]|nr:hypothetical protein [Nitrospiraceae bacterium]